MRHRPRLPLAPALAALLAFGLALPAAGQDPWPAVQPAEQALTECPEQPGAPAIFLWREVETDHNNFTTSVYHRLKVLTVAGKERANVEIPFVKGQFKVDGLRARVVHPDGRSVEFTGQVFEKTAVRAGRLKAIVKTFALPDVDVGCIVEYRYKLVPDEGRGASKRAMDAIEDAMGVQGKPREGGFDSESGPLFFTADVWDIQEDLFTRKARFAYVPSKILEKGSALIGESGMSLNWVGHKLPEVKPEKIKGRIELTFDNVPAFETEEFMPPESSLRMELRLFYIEGQLAATQVYWVKESANWQKGVEKFMRKTGAAAGEAHRVTAALESPQEKLRAIYTRAQEIKNLSYDRTLTRRRREELKIKENKNVAEVFARGYGLRSDITRAFAAMAQVAGFEAKVVRVLTRDDKLFDRNLCGLYRQFDTELAMVKIDGADKLFDPATPYCPIGMVRWSCSGSVCLVPSDNPPMFQPTPALPPDTALIQRQIALTLDAEGRLAGRVDVTFQGQEALIRRVEHIGDDEEEVRKDLEAEMAELLPAGAKVSLRDLENIDNNSDSVMAHFEVAIEGLTTMAGERTLLPVSPLLGARRHPFRHARRVHPVSFPYPCREFDDIVVTLPEGLSVETVPAAVKKDLESFGFRLVCVPEDGGKLHAQRDLVIKKTDFPLTQYKTVKAFFDEVAVGDEALVVLRRPGG